MAVEVSAFGSKKARSYQLVSETGLRLVVSNFGARLVQLWLPLADGGRNILLGCASDEAYVQEDVYIGAMVGPVAGRLSGAEVQVSGKTYSLTVNERDYNLHGGPESLHNAYWEVLELGDRFITFETVLADGQNGFPGPIAVRVTYRLEGNSLTIETEGESESDTVFNPTNHAYFNLDGDVTRSIARQTLRIQADRYAPLRSDNTPTGELLPVAGTPFDFREAAPFGQGFDKSHPQNALAQGYDHGWELQGEGPQVVVNSADQKVCLEMTTDQPAVVIYTYGWPVADGRKVVPHGAFTLETQVLPDAIKYPHFGDIILKAGERFSSRTCFKFNY